MTLRLLFELVGYAGGPRLWILRYRIPSIYRPRFLIPKHYPPSSAELDAAAIASCKKRDFLGALTQPAGMIPESRARSPKQIVIFHLKVGFQLPCRNHAPAGPQITTSLTIARRVLTFYETPRI
jgi:hypothetical protein